MIGNGEKEYTVHDRRRTDPAAFSRFRSQCLSNKEEKHWIRVDECNPEFSGLYFIRHKDFIGDIDIAEFFINSKGKRFWMTPGDPTHWAPINEYEYI